MDAAASEGGDVRGDQRTAHDARRVEEVDAAAVRVCGVGDDHAVGDHRAAAMQEDAAAAAGRVAGHDAGLDASIALVEVDAAAAEEVRLSGHCGAARSASDREAAEDREAVAGREPDGDDRRDAAGCIAFDELAIDDRRRRGAGRFDRDRLGAEIDRLAIGALGDFDDPAVAGRIDRSLDGREVLGHRDHHARLARVGHAVGVVVGLGAVGDVARVGDAVGVAVGCAGCDRLDVARAVGVAVRRRRLRHDVLVAGDRERRRAAERRRVLGHGVLDGAGIARAALT